jgi:hypothetical protein
MPAHEWSNHHRTGDITASALRQALGQANTSWWVIPTVASAGWSIYEVLRQAQRQGYFKLKFIIDIHALYSLPAHCIKLHRRCGPDKMDRLT